MSIERAAQIQFLQTWRVKASKKHLVDNEDIYLLQLLETFDILLAFLLIALVMQNDGWIRLLFKLLIIGVQSKKLSNSIFILGTTC